MMKQNNNYLQLWKFKQKAHNKSEGFGITLFRLIVYSQKVIFIVHKLRYLLGLRSYLV